MNFNEPHFGTEFRADVLVVNALRRDPLSHLTISIPKPLWNRRSGSFVSHSDVR